MLQNSENYIVFNFRIILIYYFPANSFVLLNYEISCRLHGTKLYKIKHYGISKVNYFLSEQKGEGDPLTKMRFKLKSKPETFFFLKLSA